MTSTITSASPVALGHPGGDKLPSSQHSLFTSWLRRHHVVVLIKINTSGGLEWKATAATYAKWEVLKVTLRAEWEGVLCGNTDQQAEQLAEFFHGPTGAYSQRN